MNLLSEYAIAMANLYGVIHKDQVIDTYNQQNQENLPYLNRIFLTADLRNRISRSELKKHQVEYSHPYFQSNIIINSIDKEYLIKNQEIQPIYKPEKEELLKYVNFYQKNIGEKTSVPDTNLSTY